MIRFTTMISNGNLTPQKPPFPRDSTLVENIRHFHLFMQNEPNLNIWNIAITPFLLTTNANFAAPNVKKNKPKQSQTNPISTKPLLSSTFDIERSTLDAVFPSYSYFLLLTPYSCSPIIHNQLNSLPFHLNNQYRRSSVASRKGGFHNK